MKHPAKMLPAIAATAISAYTRPGDLVIDPMCGIGTTLVEAAYLGRTAIGVEYEPYWARLARANLAHAVRHGATGDGRVVTGDARRIASLLRDMTGQAAMVLTSPPYGSYTHGHVRSSRDSGVPGVRKTNHRYSANPANLAHRNLVTLIDGFTEILAGCRQLLRPGGVVAVTMRPIRFRGELIDLPGQVLEAGQRAGLIPIDRIAALLCGLRDDGIVSRASFFQMHEARRAQARGLPVHALAHEDLLVFQTPSVLTGCPTAVDHAVMENAITPTWARVLDPLDEGERSCPGDGSAACGCTSGQPRPLLHRSTGYGRDGDDS